MAKILSKAVFKQYNPVQSLLLPPDLGDLISGNHLVRIVSQVVDQMDISFIMNAYKGGGTSSYHPRMLIKVLLYGYCMKIYTGRKIAKALREDVNFMWLSAYNRPDFRTINGFRSGLVKDHIEELFKSMLLFLMDHNYIKFENYFCDGSTFEANGNRHKMIWKKNASRYREATEQKCKELFEQIAALNDQEDRCYGHKDLEETGSFSDGSIEDQIGAQASRLNDLIAATDQKRKKRKAVSLRNQLETHCSAIRKYERQQQISGDRSGYNRTDRDATAMRMKNELILPAYNVLIGTENQFILNYSVGQKTNDAACFKDHMAQLKKHTDRKPQHIIADSIFGTEQNYELLENEGIENYMKFPLYHKEQTRKYRSNPFNKDHFIYDKQQDSYSCPNHKQLIFKGISRDRNKNGYLSHSRLYECKDCSGCPFTSLCNKSQKGNRTIQVNEKLEGYRQQARTNLRTEKGNRLKRMRGQEVESCFGDLKMNMGFRRFHLRGKAKVKAETGILLIAHNLRKIYLKKEPETA